MRKPPHVIEIFLQPGELYFGDRSTRIRTVLGSCVSLTLWHPSLLIGGMCHYMLPSRGKPAAGTLNGKYADEALERLLSEIKAAGTRPHEYELKVFGGGNMFPRLVKAGDCRDVPCKNVRAARELAVRHGFAIKAEHLGGEGHRNVIFDVWSGHVWVRQTPHASGAPDAAACAAARPQVRAAAGRSY